MPRLPILLILAAALAGCAPARPAPVAAAPVFAPCQLTPRTVVVLDTASCLAQGGIVVP